MPVPRPHLTLAHLPPTQAELRCLELLARGCTLEQVAAERGVARSTVKTQVDSARFKLRAKNTTHAVAEAIRLKLIH